MRETVIRCDHVSFQYQGADKPALRDVSLEIHAGECVVLCGQSGCGKTTLLHLFNGLAPGFFCGEVTGNCETMGLQAGQAPIEAYVPYVGSVFQNPKTQYFNVDTQSELAFPCENSGMDSGEIYTRVQNCAKDFDIVPLMGRSIFKLSGGEKQKIAFGSACMLEPRLLVLDEPTSNLDDKAIEELRKLLQKKKAEGVTLVIAEHRLAWLTDLADRYVFIKNGEIAAQWTSNDFQCLPEDAMEKYGLRTRDTAPYRILVYKKRGVVPIGETAIRTEALEIGNPHSSPIRRLENIEICHGETVGLLGRNGAGKSTLAKTLCGLIKPHSGTIFWHGEKASERQRIKNSFLVMQDVNYQLFSDSVKEEVMLGTEGSKPWEELLSSLHLLEFSDSHPMSLSGGQKQRVAVACALLSGKQFIVLDEPTSGLDHYHMAQVGGLLNRLKESGAAVLVITHDQELAALWCDRIIDMEDTNGIR